MLTTLLDEVRGRVRLDRRLIVGVAGAPGAGKSTLAVALADALGDAVTVPMDGFHLANAELRRLGLAQVKGAPHTFDSAGYVSLLRRLRGRDEEVVYAPAFDHVIDEPIAGAVAVPRSTPVVITEGNYLLVWEEVRQLLDLSVHLDVDPRLRVAGLIERQCAKGLDEAAAREWVARNDEANARLIESYAELSMLRLRRSPPEAG